MQTSTRERIVVTAARLLQRQGYTGTAIKQIAQESQATLGSIYHFFPGGKEAVAVAAIKHSSRQFAELLEKTLDSEEDAAAAVDACARHLATELRESGWIDGCPVTAAALETLGTDSEIQQACADALRGWERLVHDKLLRWGGAAGMAPALGATVQSALAGAVVALK